LAISVLLFVSADENGIHVNQVYFTKQLVLGLIKACAKTKATSFRSLIPQKEVAF